MHFVVHALDKPDAEGHRLANIDAHRAYLQTAPSKHDLTILLSGPLKTDDNSRMIGSFFLLDAKNRASVEAMFADDPLVKADVWQQSVTTVVEIRTNTLLA
ncbi:MAG: YciI family protein [Pseudomonadota bacterium]